MSKQARPANETSAGRAAAADFDMSQFYGIFFEEAAENLANYESMLLAIDVAAASDDELNAIFRVAHSIKGGAATFGFADVTELTHQLETLLDRVRKHELALTRPMVDALIESGDAVRGQLARHQGASSEVIDTSALVQRLRQLATGQMAPAVDDGMRRLRLRVGPLTDAAVADNIAELFRDIPDLGTLEAADEGTLSTAGMREFRVLTRSPDSELVELFSFHVSREQILIEPLATAGGAGGPAPVKSTAAASEDFGLFTDAPAAATEAPVAAPASSAPAEPRAKTEKSTATLESTTLRVSIEKVDQLINLVGELVITQAMLAQRARDLDPVSARELIASVSDLERNTRHLQESVMSIRMIPMSFVFNRFPRVLRDLATKLGKEIELKMVGEATELDKGLIEKIVDPLTHLVRNSADHGIESPEKRAAAGKPAHGTITLAASHQGGSILIEVRDDGAGLNRDRILRKARERGLTVQDEMSDSEVWALIWEPGFSTAEQLTDVSGRGVGMDVVRKNIAALGGTVELDSAEGYGTRVLVRLPLTLAIMDGMSIGVGGETYILPLGSVVESFQAQAGVIQSVAGSGRVVKVRGDFLPASVLADIFAVPREGGERSSDIMVIVEADGQRLAVLVDELLGQHQVVVKNLETNYRRVPHVSGATILGDGRVALILDVASLVKRQRH